MKRFCRPRAAALFVFFSLSLIIYRNLAVYFTTRCHEQEINREQISQQAPPDFGTEKKAMKTSKIIVMSLVVCFFLLSVHLLI